MIMWHGGEFVNCHPLRHRGDNLVDEFPASRSNTGTAEDFSRLRVGEEFYETILRLHDERLAVVVERIAGGQIWNTARLRFLLGEADRCDLRFGKHHV